MEEVDQWSLQKIQELRISVLKAYEDFEFHKAFHGVHDFCNTELSSFYFDVLKDRLYTFAPKSSERRSGQTALGIILRDLLQLFAPVLPHTCDEAWRHLPAHLRTEDSVHLTLFPPEQPSHAMAGETLDAWNELLRMRGIISKVLEDARRAKTIGSSLQAGITLTPGNAAIEAILKEREAQLPSVFIVSECRVLAPTGEAAANEGLLLVDVDKAPGEKCVRCWNYRPSVGSVPNHPEICERCASQLEVGEP